MKLLIDECLHTSLVEVAEARGFEARHVNWLGLSGAADWSLMQRIVDDDFTFVTNNASDLRRLYARQPLHAGLVIIVPQVPPAMQRALLDIVLEDLIRSELVNEALEIRIEKREVVIERYALPAAEEP